MENRLKIKKLGVLGGTFDPPHKGHIRAAIIAADTLGLDKVLLIPTNIPPHKHTEGRSAAPEQRLEMTEIAARADKRLKADGREIARGGVSYTYLTVSELKDEYPAAELWLICGTDMFLTVQKWRRAEEFLKRVSLAAVPRSAGDTEALVKQAEYLKKEYGVRATVIECEPIEVSSSGIRDRAGGPELLPEGVYAYIAENRLYCLKKQIEKPSEKSYNY